MRRAGALLICAALAWSLAGAGSARAACRLALVLALDVSGSVDSREYDLQINGLANALANREVGAALLSIPEAPVALAIFEWSGPYSQRVVIDWTLVDRREVLGEIIARLRSTTRGRGDPATAIGSAILTGVEMLSAGPRCWRQTIDVSGDGIHNTGPHPRDIKPRIPPALTINGLVIGTDAETSGDRRVTEIGELIGYYTAYVIHGADAFVETALGFEAFEAAMVRKLKRELESLIIGDAAPLPRGLPQPRGRRPRAQ